VKWIAAFVALVGCVGTDVVPCGDGVVCPADTTCKAVATFAENFCAQWLLGRLPVGRNLWQRGVRRSSMEALRA